MPGMPYKIKSIVARKLESVNHFHYYLCRQLKGGGMEIIMENITAGGAGTLVDIRDVTVDRELSREDRIAEFVRQIKNPYRFKCGKFTVHASFAKSGATLEECIKGILR